MALHIPTHPEHSVDNPTCNCAFCEANPTNEVNTYQSPYHSNPTISATDSNMPETGKELVRRETKDEDIYGTSLDSEADQLDQMIRQAPYLPRVQVWARRDGPYTLKIGHQWFHCDDLIINDQEYRRQSKPPSGYQPQQISSKQQTPSSNARPQRPQAARTASQQMLQNAKSARDSEERRQRHDKIEKPTAHSRRESDARRDPIIKTTNESNHLRDKERQEDRDRRGSITASQVQWPEPRRSQDSVAPPPKQARPQMPRRTSRRSQQDGGILVPMRSKGKRVRFAANT